MPIKTALRLLKFIYRYRRAKIEWSAPKEARVAILDATNVRYMTPLCGDEKYEIIHVGGERLHLTVDILLAAARWTWRTGDPQIAYVIALLECIRPFITITLIDNARLFYEISRHYRHCRFLAVQNAARYDTAHLERELAKQIHIPEYACFGKFEEDLYTKKEAKVGRFYPIGSLRDSYYREQFAAQNEKIEYDICVVGEPSPGWDRLEHLGFEDAIGNIAKYAVIFSKKHNKRLCIAGKRDPGTVRDSESEWYEKYIGKDIQIIPRVREQYTTYGLIDRSAVSVSFISTALQEGFGRGKRVLFCNFTGHRKWDFPVEGIWRLNDPSYEAFEERLLKLLAMTDQEFRTASSETAQYMMNYNEKLPTHLFLQKLITDAVSGECDKSRSRSDAERFVS